MNANGATRSVNQANEPDELFFSGSGITTAGGTTAVTLTVTVTGSETLPRISIATTYISAVVSPASMLVSATTI